jgi:hypothetical protein
MIKELVVHSAALRITPLGAIDAAQRFVEKRTWKNAS